MEGVWIQISINLDPELYKRLREEADTRSLAPSTLAQQILKEALAGRDYRSLHA